MSLYSFLMVQLKKIFGVTCGSHSHFHSLRTSHPKKIWPGTAKFRRHRILVSIFWRQMSLTQMTSQKRLRKLFIWPKVWIAFSANSIFFGGMRIFQVNFLVHLVFGRYFRKQATPSPLHCLHNFYAHICKSIINYNLIFHIYRTEYMFVFIDYFRYWRQHYNTFILMKLS